MPDSLFSSNHGWTAPLASIVDHELFIVLFLSLAACLWYCPTTQLSRLWSISVRVFHPSLVPRLLPPSAQRMTFDPHDRLAYRSRGSKVIREIIARKEGGAWERGYSTPMHPATVPEACPPRTRSTRMKRKERMASAYSKSSMASSPHLYSQHQEAWVEKHKLSTNAWLTYFPSNVTCPTAPGSRSSRHHAVRDSSDTVLVCTEGRVPLES